MSTILMSDLPSTSDTKYMLQSCCMSSSFDFDHRGCCSAIISIVCAYKTSRQIILTKHRPPLLIAPLADMHSLPILNPAPHAVGVFGGYCNHSRTVSLKLQQNVISLSHGDYTVTGIMDDSTIFDINGKTFSLHGRKGQMSHFNVSDSS
jgi:hypothetical protein